MGEKAFGYDPIGSSPVPTDAGRGERGAGPVTFSGPGDTAHGDVANEADRYSRPRPLTPAAGPSYDPDHYEQMVEWVADPDVAPHCERDLDYSDGD